MANIHAVVQKTIADGYKLKFRTPCDSTTIEGLEVKYPAKNGVGTLIKNFVFKDAHGTELSGVGNLFVSGVMIEVLLDVTHGVAYIQNADTNSYIESVKREISAIEKNTKEMLTLAEKAVDDCEDATSNANKAAAVAREVVGGITTIEQNNNTPLQFWVGSKEEYDAIETKDNDVFYIISDDADYQEIANAIEALAGGVEKNTEDIQENKTTIEELDKAVKNNETTLSKHSTDIENNEIATAQLQTHLNEPVIVVDDSTQTENKLQELFKAMPNTTFARYYISMGGSYSVFELSKAVNGWGHMERMNYGSRLFRTVRGGKDENGNITYTFEPWVEFAPVQSPLEMQPGVEYALNEKYLGNTVYSKIISVNASAEIYYSEKNDYRIRVNHGIDNLSFVKIVSIIHKYQDENNKIFNDITSIGSVSIVNNEVQMAYDKSLISGNVYIELKYTKG